MSRVARYHADRTNQKLYFVRLACQQAEKTTNAQQAQGEQEAAVFHLQGALIAFLQELARYYKLDDAKPSISSIKEKMAMREQVSPEITVLEQYSQSGFLMSLNRAYMACQYAPEPPTPMPEDEASSQLILKVTQGMQSWLPDVVMIKEWHSELTQLIEGFRNQMIEF